MKPALMTMATNERCAWETSDCRGWWDQSESDSVRERCAGLLPECGSCREAIVARADVQCCRVTAVGMVANASHPTERGRDGSRGSAPAKPDGDLILVK